MKEISPFFLHFLKDYTTGSKITNLRSIYHPERRDYHMAKMGFKTGAGKTQNQFVFDGSFFNIALKCRVFRF